MKATTWTLNLLIAGLLGAPYAAAAQNHHPDEAGAKQESNSAAEMMPMCHHMMSSMAGRGMGMGEGMMGMMGSRAMGVMLSPRVILMQKDALDLSDEQIERLESLKKRMDHGREPGMSQAHTMMQQLDKALDPENPDLATYESLLNQMVDHHVQMQVQMARLGIEALNVLTDDQRDKVRYGTKLMHAMMGGMMMGGEHPPRQER